jgi:hypothetical protein
MQSEQINKISCQLPIYDGVIGDHAIIIDHDLVWNYYGAHMELCGVHVTWNCSGMALSFDV